jgi:hypothetical protein
VPSAAGSATHDITTGFSGTGNRLYAGILRAPSSDLERLGTKDGKQPVTMTTFQSRSNADQPFIHAATVRDGPDRGRERVYIGDNDFNAQNGQTATLDQSLESGRTIHNSPRSDWNGAIPRVKTVRKFARFLTRTAPFMPLFTVGAPRPGILAPTPSG